MERRTRPETRRGRPEEKDSGGAAGDARSLEVLGGNAGLTPGAVRDPLALRVGLGVLHEALAEVAQVHLHRKGAELGLQVDATLRELELAEPGGRTDLVLHLVELALHGLPGALAPPLGLVGVERLEVRAHVTGGFAALGERLLVLSRHLRRTPLAAGLRGTAGAGGLLRG